MSELSIIDAVFYTSVPGDYPLERDYARVVTFTVGGIKYMAWVGMDTSADAPSEEQYDQLLMQMAEKRHNATFRPDGLVIKSQGATA